MRPKDEKLLRRQANPGATLLEVAGKLNLGWKREYFFTRGVNWCGIKGRSRVLSELLPYRYEIPGSTNI